MSLCSVKTSSFILRVVEDAVLREHFLQLDQLRFDSRALPGAVAWSISLSSSQDFLAEGGGIDRGDDLFELGHDLLLLFVGQFVEVVGKPLGRSAPAGSFRVGQDLLALVPHALQAAANGVDAGGEPALEHGHREAEGAAARGIVGSGLDGLVLDVARQGVVEVQFVVVDVGTRWSARCAW